jgi:hypothetical protein
LTFGTSKVMSMFQHAATSILGMALAQLPEGAPGGADAGRVESEVFKWGGILIALIVIGGGAIMFIRRRLRDAAANSGADAGFSLSDLRAMRDRGEITPEEYDLTRSRVIAKVKGKMAEPQKVTASPAHPTGEKPPELALPETPVPEAPDQPPEAPPEPPQLPPPGETSSGENSAPPDSPL